MSYKPKILSLSEGGTNANLAASNKGIFISTASAGAIANLAASVAGTSASPTATTSATYVMMGLGSSWTITPTTFGNVRIQIDGQLKTAEAGGSATLILSYGTGAAPSNGTAATGTTVGLNTIWNSVSGLQTEGIPFSKGYIITALTPGTAYWFDVQMLSSDGAHATILNVAFTAQELIS